MSKATFCYPFRGPVYFLSHSRLWPFFFQGLGVFLLVSLFSLVVFFFLLLGRQLSVVTKLFGFASWFPSHSFTVVLTFLESGFFLRLVADLLLGMVLNAVFEEVLTMRNLRKRDQSTLKDTLLSETKLVVVEVAVFLVSAPLNALPLIGTFLFLAVNGLLYAWRLHKHYFDIKGLAFNQQWHRVFSEQLWGYVAFGVVAMSLSVLPVFNIFFIFSNTVAAALWAADLEWDEMRRCPEAQWSSFCDARAEMAAGPPASSRGVRGSAVAAYKKTREQAGVDATALPDFLQAALLAPGNAPHPVPPASAPPLQGAALAPDASAASEMVAAGTSAASSWVEAVASAISS